MTSLHRLFVIAFLFICLLLIPSAFGDTISTWSYSPRGSWSDSANWTSMTVPNNSSSQSYGVIVNSGQPNLDINATVNTLTFGPSDRFTWAPILPTHTRYMT
jgi:hypothetical protein